MSILDPVLPDEAYAILEGIRDGKLPPIPLGALLRSYTILRNYGRPLPTGIRSEAEVDAEFCGQASSTTPASSGISAATLEQARGSGSAILGFDEGHRAVTCANVRADPAALGRIVTWTPDGEAVRAGSPGGRAWDRAIMATRKALGAETVETASTTPATFLDRVNAVRKSMGSAPVFKV